MKIRKEKQGKIFFSKGIIIVCLLLALAMAMVFPSNAEAAKLNKKSVTLLKGKTATLMVKGTKKKAVWRMGRKGIVRFTAKKNTYVKMRAVRAGETTVSAKIGKKTYKCKVRVVDPKLSSSNVNLKVGESKVLKVLGGTGRVKWQINNPTVVMVNKGLVTAKRTGEAKITAVCNGKRITCMVSVRGKVPVKNEGNNSTQSTQPQGKKVWVVTKEAWIEQRSVYTNIRSEWECSCGYKTESLVEFSEHQENNWTNEHARSRVNTLKDFSHVETIEHPEEGYWKYV